MFTFSKYTQKLCEIGKHFRMLVAYTSDPWTNSNLKSKKPVSCFKVKETLLPHYDLEKLQGGHLLQRLQRVPHQIHKNFAKRRSHLSLLKAVRDSWEVLVVQPAVYPRIDHDDNLVKQNTTWRNSG